jgi:hypothetical protein
LIPSLCCSCNADRRLSKYFYNKGVILAQGHCLSLPNFVQVVFNDGARLQMHPSLKTVLNKI